MISIIICSTHTATSPKLEANIAQTIGVSYEIVHIDNSLGRYSICQAYNIGAERAKGDILCFMHEDIRFHSSHWGERVETYLSASEVGMLGVAGATLVPARGDWRFVDSEYHVNRLIQGFVTPSGHYDVAGQNWKATGQLRPVAILDGVWFCIRKDLFPPLKFDQNQFPSFHLYDSDISMQVNALGEKLCVCDDIILEHFSEGTFSESFSVGLDDFLQKWRDSLPFVKGSDSLPSAEEMEKQASIAAAHYEKRLKTDIVLTEYRRWQREGAMDSFPKEKQKVVWEWEYKCLKKAIKLPIPMKRVWQNIMSYPSEYRKRKSKLIYKFIYYRFFVRPFCWTKATVK